MNFDVLFRIVICCLFHRSETYGFNVDIENAIVFDGPSKSDYFGYSVSLHSWESKYWVIVGAPLSNVTSATGSETLIRYGAVYKCEYTGSQQCSIINIDNQPVWRKQVTFNDVPNTWINMEEKSGMWLGGLVYSTGKNGKALACAPRYIFRGVPVPGGADGDIHYSWLLGRCNLLQQDLSGVSQNGVIDPCAAETKGNNYYGYCTAGLSAEYSADGYNVIMGTAGARRGRGGIMLHSAEGKTIKSELSELAIGDYMGYSVTSGHFTQTKQIEFLSGAPRANGVKGKVVIYQIYKGYLSVKSTLPPPKNLPTGTYFGSVICAVDLDNNQFTDVLVGAPYFTHMKDEGRVFVYLNNGQGALNLQDNFLEGDRKVNAHFGQSIAAVGDLNADGFQDVAIGAPFEGEDGSGAVYLYHGSSKGIELRYRQKILGSTVKSGIKLFGFSLSGGVDVDENGYPDVAVGAYGSDNAVILRSRSIVNVGGKIRLNQQQITLEGNDSLCDLEGTQHKCLNITLIFDYYDAISATARQGLSIRHSVELDKDKGQEALRRLFFWDALSRKRKFILKDNYTIPTRNTYYSLQPLTVYLMKEDEIGDVNSPLTFDLSISLPLHPCDGPCPVLNSYLPSTIRSEVAFKKKCKNHACAPDLALSGNLFFSPGYIKELRIGVVKDFAVHITVENKAEDSAYTSKIKVKHPDNLYYIGADQGVECDKSTPINSSVTMTCDVGNPLQGKTSMSFAIKFSPGAVRKPFILEIEALSQDEDANDEDNKIRFPMTVKFEADVEITGSSKQYQVVYSGPVRDEDDVKKNWNSIGPEVLQTFTVRNKGPSAVDGSVVTVNFRHLYSLSKPESYLLYLLQIELEGASGSCNAKVNPLDIKVTNATSRRNDKQSRKRRNTEENTLLGCQKSSCKSFQCSLGTLKMGDKAEITMTFRLWKNTLLKELKPLKAVDLETSATVKVPDEITQPDEKNDMATILTIAKPAQTEGRKKKVPWWIIFSSALSGGLLLGTAIALLYRRGFFKKKRAEGILSPAEERTPMNP